MAVRSSAEPPAKISRKEATGEELSDLLTQPPEILIKICNYLDPNSFRELAFTCRALYNFCRHAKGIKVAVVVKYVWLEVHMDEEDKFCNSSYHCHNGTEHGYLSLEKYLQNLNRWPFTISIYALQNLIEPELWHVVKLDVKEFLVRNGVKKVTYMDYPMPKTVEEVEQISTEFLTAFNIEEVFFNDTVTPSDDVIEACLRLSLSSLCMTSFLGYIDFDPLRTCSIAEFETSLSIPLNGLDAVIQRWTASNNLKKWTFGYEFTSNDFIDYFNRYEVRFFNYKGPIDRNNPPVFLNTMDNSEGRTAISIYILRSDGKIMCVTISPHPDSAVQPRSIEFRMCPVDKGPLSLRDI